MPVVLIIEIASDPLLRRIRAWRMLGHVMYARACCEVQHNAGDP